LNLPFPFLFRVAPREASGSMTQNRRNTKSAAARQWRPRNGVTSLTNRTCTHAFITLLKARRGVGGGWGVGVRFCRASPRDKSSLCRARKWREQRKSEREREQVEAIGRRAEKGVHYIYLGCISGGACIPKLVSGFVVTWKIIYTCAGINAITETYVNATYSQHSFASRFALHALEGCVIYVGGLHLIKYKLL